MDDLVAKKQPVAGYLIELHKRSTAELRRALSSSRAKVDELNHTLEDLRRARLDDMAPIIALERARSSDEAEMRLPSRSHEDLTGKATMREFPESPQSSNRQASSSSASFPYCHQTQSNMVEQEESADLTDYTPSRPSLSLRSLRPGNTIPAKRKSTDTVHDEIKAESYARYSDDHIRGPEFGRPQGKRRNVTPVDVPAPSLRNPFKEEHILKRGTLRGEHLLVPISKLHEPLQGSLRELLLDLDRASPHVVVEGEFGAHAWRYGNEPGKCAHCFISHRSDTCEQLIGTEGHDNVCEEAFQMGELTVYVIRDPSTGDLTPVIIPSNDYHVSMLSIDCFRA